MQRLRGRQLQRLRAERCTDIWQQKLRDYQEPAMPADRLEALEEFMIKRKVELKDSYI